MVSVSSRGKHVALGCMLGWSTESHAYGNAVSALAINVRLIHWTSTQDGRTCEFSVIRLRAAFPMRTWSTEAQYQYRIEIASHAGVRDFETGSGCSDRIGEEIGRLGNIIAAMAYMYRTLVCKTDGCGARHDRVFVSETTSSGQPLIIASLPSFDFPCDFCGQTHFYQDDDLQLWPRAYPPTQTENKLL